MSEGAKEGFGCLPRLVQIKEELVRTSFSSAETNKVRTKNARAQIRKMYSNGQRKVVFLALQCVGFNQKLYDAFAHAQVETNVPKVIGKRRRQEEEFERTWKSFFGEDDRARSATETFGD